VSARGRQVIAALVLAIVAQVIAVSLLLGGCAEPGCIDCADGCPPGTACVDGVCARQCVVVPWHVSDDGVTPCQSGQDPGCNSCAYDQATPTPGEACQHEPEMRENLGVCRRQDGAPTCPMTPSPGSRAPDAPAPPAGFSVHAVKRVHAGPVGGIVAVPDTHVGARVGSTADDSGD